MENKTDKPTVQIDTEGVQQLVGRTIVKADRDPPSGKPYEMYEEGLTLTLDDRSEWTFMGSGYDASSLEIFMTPPPIEPIDGKNEIDGK